MACFMNAGMMPKGEVIRRVEGLIADKDFGDVDLSEMIINKKSKKTVTKS